MQIGAQLYTVRDFCKTLPDFEETLKRVADIGYQYIQVSGTCAYDPLWLKETLDRTGLKCVLTHIPPERIAEKTLEAIADHNIFDCRNIGIGYYEVHKEGIEAFYKKFCSAAAMLHAQGKRLCYHNHDQEFIRLESQAGRMEQTAPEIHPMLKGRTVLELLAERFSPEELCFTPDTYWIQAGGADPAQWIRKLSGRVPCVHLKDMAYGRKMAALGTGNLNLDGAIAACEEAGTEYLLVEQDDCYGEDPFACLKTSYEFLKARGF